MKRSSGYLWASVFAGFVGTVFTLLGVIHFALTLLLMAAMLLIASDILEALGK